ncbi:MAG: alkaline phosphatase D family protein [Pseudomonadota bacterium]|nr:alkaline phosphatase D family protein [Pseudomonadota bacterium]
MPLTRRRLLQSSAGLALLSSCGAPTGTPDSGPDEPVPSPARSPEPSPWSAPGTLDDVAFDRGMQVGDVGPSGAMISIRTAEPALTLVLMREEADGWIEVSRTPVTGGDGGAQLALDGLEPDTAYTACFYAPDDTRRCAPSRFRTALEEGAARIVTFGASSCFGGNRPWPTLSFAAAEQLDFFVLLGDTVYADGAETVADYRVFWDEALSTGGLRALCSSTSLVATWDDHEVGNDWSPETDAVIAVAALQAFREALPIAGEPIWRALRWGDAVELFVLDCRGERRDGDYVSPEQMAWLQDALAASPARFKIIVNSVPITHFAGTALSDYFDDQRWQGFPAQREEILAFIRDQEIGGVVWLAGDFHFGLLARVDPAGGAGEDAWEVLAGPGGSFLNPIVELLDDTDRFPVAFGAFNYVRFSADPGTGTLSVAWIGDDGAIIDEAVLEV